MSIQERITEYWGLTEAQLLSSEALHYARAKDRRTQDAIGDLWRTYAPGDPVPSELALDAFGNTILERYLAATITLALVPIARDYYMQERTSKSVSSGLGGGLSATYIRKIDELRDLEARLTAEISSLEPLVGIEVKPALVPTRPVDAPSISLKHRVVDPVANFRRRGTR